MGTSRRWRLRCAAWMRVEQAPAEKAGEAQNQWLAAEAKRRADHEKAMEVLRRKGEGARVTAFEERPFPSVQAGEGYIQGRLYEWSPWSNEWLSHVSTERVKAGSGWRQVSFEVDSPAWGPYLDIRFFATLGSTAYIDEFSFRDIGPAEPKPK